MRHFLIDTDTASDDAVAVVMALRHPDVQVKAITVVAGHETEVMLRKRRDDAAALVY